MRRLGATAQRVRASRRRLHLFDADRKAVELTAADKLPMTIEPRAAVATSSREPARR